MAELSNCLGYCCMKKMMWAIFSKRHSTEHPEPALQSPGSPPGLACCGDQTAPNSSGGTCAFLNLEPLFNLAEQRTAHPLPSTLRHPHVRPDHWLGLFAQFCALEIKEL